MHAQVQTIDYATKLTSFLGEFEDYCLSNYLC